MKYSRIEHTWAMRFQSNTVFSNAASSQKAKSERNEADHVYWPRTVRHVPLVISEQMHMKHQCNAMGRKIGFNDGSVCDSTSQIVCMPATQSPAPDIHSLHLKCEYCPLLMIGGMSRTMEVIFPLLHSIYEVASVSQCQVKKCNSSSSLFLCIKRAPENVVASEAQKRDSEGN